MTWRPRLGRGGTAGLEFALIGSVMAAMLLGTVELAAAIRVQAKLNVAAGQLVEMIAAQSGVSEGSAQGPGGTLGDLCTAAAYNLLPYPTATLSAWVNSTIVAQQAGNLAIVANWMNDTSCPGTNQAGGVAEAAVLTTIADQPRSLFTADGTPYASGGTLVLGYSAISARLTYTYQNILSFLLGKTLTFTAVAAARPRANTGVSCTYLSGSVTVSCPASY